MVRTCVKDIFPLWAKSMCIYQFTCPCGVRHRISTSQWFISTDKKNTNYDKFNLFYIYARSKVIRNLTNRSRNNEKSVDWYIIMKLPSENLCASIFLLTLHSVKYILFKYSFTHDYVYKKGILRNNKGTTHSN